MKNDPDDVYDAVLKAIEGEAVPEADTFTIRRFAELVDERQALRDALDADGPILREPVVSPRGDVVGERVVAHPALSALRAIDRALEAVSASLGLSPAARRRMKADLSDLGEVFA